jgi:hypothetical protein
MASSSSDLLDVNGWRISTRLSKSTTCAISAGLSRRTNSVADFCNVSSLSSMLALLSRSRDSAMGCWRLLKKVSSCFTPSSKM